MCWCKFDAQCKQGHQLLFQNRQMMEGDRNRDCARINKSNLFANLQIFWLYILDKGLAHMQPQSGRQLVPSTTDATIMVRVSLGGDKNRRTKTVSGARIGMSWAQVNLKTRLVKSQILPWTTVINGVQNQ
jgi:hypothetical protein